MKDWSALRLLRVILVATSALLVTLRPAVSRARLVDGAPVNGVNGGAEHGGTDGGVDGGTDGTEGTGSADEAHKPVEDAVEEQQPARDAQGVDGKMVEGTAAGRTAAGGNTAGGSAFSEQEDEKLSIPGSSTFGVGVRPARLNVDYVQFGVGLALIFPIHLHALCPPDAEVPCVFGIGGGLVARGGYHSRDAWYLGGAYSMEKIETNGLMRMGVLQQLAGEFRYLFRLGYRTEPFVMGGLGANLFGNEGGAEAFGITVFAAAGAEMQISRSLLVGLMALYRPILFLGWKDAAGQQRDTGVNHFWGLGLMINAREALQR